MDRSDQLVAFLAGLTPRATHRAYMDLSAGRPAVGAGPSAGLACHLCSGVAAAEIGQDPSRPVTDPPRTLVLPVRRLPPAAQQRTPAGRQPPHLATNQTPFTEGAFPPSRLGSTHPWRVIKAGKPRGREGLNRIFLWSSSFPVRSIMKWRPKIHEARFFAALNSGTSRGRTGRVRDMERQDGRSDT